MKTKISLSDPLKSRAGVGKQADRMITLQAADWLNSCDFCQDQEGRHYCLLHGVTAKNMDTVKCKDWVAKG